MSKKKKILGIILFGGDPEPLNCFLEQKLQKHLPEIEDRPYLSVVRGFSIGFLTACILLTLVYFLRLR